MIYEFRIQPSSPSIIESLKEYLELNAISFELVVYNNNADEPYLESPGGPVISHNPEYNENAECSCGHPYYRHFDTYEEMAPVGCKYCECYTFTKAVND